MNLTSPELQFDTAVFDLDGVITQTAWVHAISWKALFDDFLRERASRLGVPFVEFDIETDYLGRVDGKPRYKGVQSFLDSRSIDLPYGDPSDGPDEETVCGLGNRKQGFFVQNLQKNGVQVYQPSIDLLNDLRGRGIRLGVATSSKNCQLVLEKAGLKSFFEARVDGVYSAQNGLSGKPDPDIFIKTVELLGMRVEKAVVFEDAVSGVQAGRAGGFGLVIGVLRGGRRDSLWEGGADLVVPCLSEISIDSIDHFFREKKNVRPSALWKWQDIERLLAKRPACFVINLDCYNSAGISSYSSSQFFEHKGKQIRKLAKKLPVVIINDSKCQDPTTTIRLDGVFYIDNGGTKLTGPDGFEVKLSDKLGDGSEGDRGELVQVLPNQIGLSGAKPCLIYIGNNANDESAFAAIREWGIGILLTELPRSTNAEYSLQRIEDVDIFVDKLINYL